MATSRKPANRKPVNIADPAEASKQSADKPTRKRSRLQARNILSVENKDPNFVYRFMADRPGRIATKKEEGWEIVDADMEVGDKRVNQGHAVDSRVVVRSGAEELILMRIRKEWYEEDAQVIQTEIDELENSLTRTYSRNADENGMYGGVEISRRPMR